ncbi:hypothetical protein AWB75_01530 [Caballeronia catudaia]|uniref:Uncharacterized protein n=1 Tax=Caballeronia catudaia TaxID=1777136 RepID=A0A158A0A2_9BURK|nr:hypothetical protein AWB75_01530 [Caballeronia catudaia]
MRVKDERGVRRRTATLEFYLSYRDEMLAITWRIGQMGAHVERIARLSKGHLSSRLADVRLARVRRFVSRLLLRVVPDIE